jgi:ATP-dependent Clp protease protease subunit|tara:strand:+ start:332 stop:883 length:552 start_codon:yes stop_codon:yes gene_type:complete
MADGEEKSEVAPPPPETRVMGLFQEIDEQKSEELIYALKLYKMESEDEIEFYINSPGGCASDMFAVYDFMRHTRETASISTFGMGKVMSASVLLLAAGTKGRRKIGKSCRVMIHSVIAGNAGGLHDLKNEMKEIQKTQDLYIDALCKETKLTKKKVKDLFSKNVNVYLSAEEAVEYGIADIVV